MHTQYKIQYNVGFQDRSIAQQHITDVAIQIAITVERDLEQLMPRNVRILAQLYAFRNK